MKIKKKQKIEIIITMDETEATWLKGVMQNPLHGQTPQQENETDSHNRMNIFLALNEEGLK